LSAAALDGLGHGDRQLADVLRLQGRGAAEESELALEKVEKGGGGGDTRSDQPVRVVWVGLSSISRWRNTMKNRV
jgi:hypothetical protein